MEKIERQREYSPIHNVHFGPRKAFLGQKSRYNRGTEVGPRPSKLPPSFFVFFFFFVIVVRTPKYLAGTCGRYRYRSPANWACEVAFPAGNLSPAALFPVRGRKRERVRERGTIGNGLERRFLEQCSVGVCFSSSITAETFSGETKQPPADSRSTSTPDASVLRDWGGISGADQLL
ncbi:hypothetical protein CRG98_033622 [Punica granatum]|uniref:Uncharacterized protein n=1 Tax=Punica granatum TaxID=22663 RepID=A0A2I0IPR0_PUNGR|nr:hypothetical protein CRG98_033622 [Punica granatum]